MKIKQTDRFGIIQKFVIVLALFVMSLIWPAGLFPVNQVSESAEEYSMISNPSDAEVFFRQEFAPTFDEVNSISVYIANDPEAMDTMLSVFRLYNTSGICLQEYSFQAEELELPGYVTVPITVKLTAGTTYFYTIQGLDGSLFSAYCKEEQKAPELGQLFYKEVPSGGQFLNTVFEYTRPMGMKRILFFDALTGLAAFLILILVSLLRDKAGEEKWRRAEGIGKTVLTVLAAAALAVSLYAIAIRRIFSRDGLNIAVLCAGTLIAAALLIYGIRKCPSEYDALSEEEKTKGQKAICFIRGILWAAVILSCCRNNNAMTDYEKGLYMREMITIIGILIVSYGSRKEIFNIPNILFSVLSVIGGYFYVSANSDHIEHIQTAVRTSFAAWSMVLVFIHFIYSAVKGRFRRFQQASPFYILIVAAFWILCVVFAEGREWPLTVLLVFSVWSVEFIISDDRRQILEDICNGILLALLGTVIFCLYRRAYQYYILMRYAGIYFTVTATAVYLCVPVCAAFARLTDIRRVGIKKRILELLLLGMVLSYMLFTISRTGLITVGVVGLFALFFPFKGQAGGFVLRQLKHTGVILVSFLLCVVLFFSMTRMIPAINGNPFYFFLEKEWSFVSKDTAMDGPEYITVQRFGEMVIKRIFGLGGVYEVTGDKEETQEQTSIQTEPVTKQVQAEPLQTAAEEPVPLEAQMPKEQEPVSDYSNGRLGIYKAYLSEIGLKGHQDMGIEVNGEMIMHAHNTYIQTAYDFGLPVGIYFLFVCLVTFIRACGLAYRWGAKNKYAILPLLIAAAFGVAAAFELVYLPSIPLGLAFLLMLPAMMLKKEAWSEVF